jgi:hypothetical protein
MPFLQQSKETLQINYQEPEGKVGYLAIDGQTSLVDSGMVKFVIMSHIPAANCAVALSVIFQNYSLNE